MSNLSELLPAGAGAKSASFVASGTLGSGVTVALKSDGTVEAVGQISESVGTPVVFEANAASIQYYSAAYDSSNNKVVISYRDSDTSEYGTSIVGTVSGSSISFGTKVVFESASTSRIASTYDSTNGKIVIGYRDQGNSNQGTAIVGTVSGTSISFGSPVIYETGAIDNNSSAYDSANGKVVFSYTDDGNTGYGTSVVGTVSGTSISFGTPVVFESADTGRMSTVYDSENEKIVVTYSDNGNGDYGTSVVGTVSGTSISFGTPVVWQSSGLGFISSTYDSVNRKIFIAFWTTSLTGGQGVVGTVSGTSITFGSAVAFNAVNTYRIEASYNQQAGKVVVAYRDVGNSNYGTVVSGTISGSSVSFDTPSVFDSTQACNFLTGTYDSDNGKNIFAYEKDTDNDGASFVYSPASSNYTDFIGITDQAIADTATGSVVVEGGVTEKVSGLTTGSTYYVQDDGTLSTTVSSVPAGRALSSTSILLEG